jgi:hypothetical protein
MHKDPPTLRLCTMGHLLVLLIKKIAGCLEKSTNTNSKQDTIAEATTISLSTPRSASRNSAPYNTDALGTRGNDFQTFLSMSGADLQAALDKHWDDALHLLRMGTTAGQNIIPKKILTKVRKANMTTMTQVNTLIARAGGKELSTQRMKELGSIAKYAAMELYNTKVAEKKAMEHEPPPDINDSINSDVMIANQESTMTDLQHANKFRQSHFPNRMPHSEHGPGLELLLPLHFGSIEP